MEHTIRQKLHNAIDAAESAAATMREATRAYDLARNEVNALINQLAPLHSPNGCVTTVNAPPDKIKLIKLVRTATQEDRRLQQPTELQPGCMGLGMAKELVEKFIADNNL
jgi:hypothetical protein